MCLHGLSRCCKAGCWDALRSCQMTLAWAVYRQARSIWTHHRGLGLLGADRCGPGHLRRSVCGMHQALNNIRSGCAVVHCVGMWQWPRTVQHSLIAAGDTDPLCIRWSQQAVAAYADSWCALLSHFVARGPCLAHHQRERVTLGVSEAATALRAVQNRWRRTRQARRRCPSQSQTAG